MKKLIFSLGFLLIVFGCNKYPEGPDRSMHRLTVRITGHYKVSSFTVNGVDSTAAMTSNPGYMCGSENYPIEFPNGTHWDVINHTCHDRTFSIASWDLSKDKKQMIIVSKYDPSSDDLYPLIINRDVTIYWTIQRLTMQDLWMKTTFAGKEYYIKLQEKD
jgi:hypothetical protein